MKQENKFYAEKWKVLDEIDFPCADISFKWESEKNHRLIITMHFSRVIGGLEKDLLVTFTNPISIQWEKESFCVLDFPQKKPMCGHERFNNWTYPLLIFKNSEWANVYAAYSYTAKDYDKHKIVHFGFISMNDTLYVLSEEKPHVMLVESMDN